VHVKSVKGMMNSYFQEAVTIFRVTMNHTDTGNRRAFLLSNVGVVSERVSMVRVLTFRRDVSTLNNYFTTKFDAYLILRIYRFNQAKALHIILDVVDLVKIIELSLCVLQGVVDFLELVALVILFVNKLPKLLLSEHYLRNFLFILN
jgi:hypothetical protein